MNFIVISSYDNYVPAHLAMGRLEEDGIRAWLKDEHTVTIDPILANAVGGIKLMVAESQAERARDILTTLQNEFKASQACPNCSSHDIALVTTPRKSINWISAITTFFLGDFALGAGKVYHCFHCSHEFETPVSIYPVMDEGSDFTS